MKQIIILLMMLFSLECYAQNKADAITGNWLKTNKEDLKIEVYKVEDEYKGKLSWAKDKKKYPVGFVMLDNLEYNSNKNFGKMENSCP